MLPIFLAALLLVRGVPALLYRRLTGDRRAVVAGLLRRPRCPSSSPATAIGLDLGVISEADERGLIGANCCAVLIFRFSRRRSSLAARDRKRSRGRAAARAAEAASA